MLATAGVGSGSAELVAGVFLPQVAVS